MTLAKRCLHGLKKMAQNARAASTKPEWTVPYGAANVDLDRASLRMTEGVDRLRIEITQLFDIAVIEMIHTNKISSAMATLALFTSTHHVEHYPLLLHSCSILQITHGKPAWVVGSASEKARTA